MEVTCLRCWEGAFITNKEDGKKLFKCLFKCKKLSKDRLKEPRVCPRTKKLVETLPLDSEISCDLHPKETAMHYDHSLSRFSCLQCARLERLSEMPEVVETDRNVLLKNLHVLNELLDK